MRISGNFFNDEQKIWFAYTWFEQGNHISVVELDPNDISLTKQPTPIKYNLLDSRDEIYDSNTGERLELCQGEIIGVNNCVAEGPFIMKRNNRYILFYSANHVLSRNYSIYYKSASSLECLERGRENNPECEVRNGIAYKGGRRFLEYDPLGLPRYSLFTYSHGSIITGPDGNHQYHIISLGNFFGGYRGRSLIMVEQEFNDNGDPIETQPLPYDETNVYA